MHRIHSLPVENWRRGWRMKRLLSIPYVYDITTLCVCTCTVHTSIIHVYYYCVKNQYHMYLVENSLPQIGSPSDS